MTRRFLGWALALGLMLFAAPTWAQVAGARAGDRVVGRASAPVTLTAYVSATCGHCARWHALDWPHIQERWVATGKVKVVFRDFFTGPRESALKGSVLARCAPEDRFDAVMGALMGGQADLHELRDEAKWLRRGAMAGGLSDSEASACLADANGIAAAERRDAQAQADGVMGTPFFFLNGRPLEAWTLSEFDAALAAAVGGR